MDGWRVAKAKAKVKLNGNRRLLLVISQHELSRGPHPLAAPHRGIQSVSMSPSNRGIPAIDMHRWPTHAVFSTKTLRGCEPSDDKIEHAT